MSLRSLASSSTASATPASICLTSMTFSGLLDSFSRTLGGLVRSTGSDKTLCGRGCEARHIDADDLQAPTQGVEGEGVGFLHGVVAGIRADRHQHSGCERDQLRQSPDDALLERGVLGLLAQEPGAVGDVA